MSILAKSSLSFPTYEGWKIHLLKGDSGERAGKFLLLFEIESIEAPDRFYPTPSEASEEARRFWEQHPEAVAMLEKHAGFLHEPHREIDYLVVGSAPS